MPCSHGLHSLLWMADTRKGVPGSRAGKLSGKAEILPVHRDINVIIKILWYNKTRFPIIVSTNKSTHPEDKPFFF